MVRVVAGWYIVRPSVWKLPVVIAGVGTVEMYACAWRTRLP